MFIVFGIVASRINKKIKLRRHLVALQDRRAREAGRAAPDPRRPHGDGTGDG